MPDWIMRERWHLPGGSRKKRERDSPLHVSRTPECVVTNASRLYAARGSRVVAGRVISQGLCLPPSSIRMTRAFRFAYALAAEVQDKRPRARIRD